MSSRESGQPQELLRSPELLCAVFLCCLHPSYALSSAEAKSSSELHRVTEQEQMSRPVSIWSPIFEGPVRPETPAGPACEPQLQE